MQGLSFIKNNMLIPNRLIYKTKQNGLDDYRMFDIKQGSLLGFMLINPERQNKKSLYIDYLKVFERNQGVGSDFIKFAETLSKQLGLCGHIMVDSCKLKGETKLPHLFYRKNGFTTSSKIKDFILDICISLGISQCNCVSKCLKMFK